MTGILKMSKNYIALEMIDFQDNSFGIQIEAIVSKIQIAINEGELFVNETAELQSLIFKRTGLRVVLVTDTTLAAILPFYSNKHSIFIADLFKGNFPIKDQDKILNQSHDKKGYVDIKKAKVSGVFSEYTNRLWINFSMLFNHYSASPGEVTAILLHELGHAFSVCEYSDRLESNNQILANVAIEIMSAKKEKDLSYIYRELSKVNKNTTEEEVETLVNGNKVIAGYTWFKTVIGSVSSQTSNGKYDETSFEQLADNFSARFGYGRQLITVLDKLHDYFGNPEKNKTWNSLRHISTALFSYFYLALTAFSLSAIFPIGLYLSLVGFIVLMVSGENFKDYTYDELKIRYKRIRREYVELIKTLDIPSEELKTILDNIYFMDNIVNNTHRYNSIVSKIANVLFSSNRKANQAIQEQQLLEELAMNDLFISAATLKTL